MSDNELILKLQTDVLNVLNSSQMPLMVKALVVENVLLKVNTSVKDEIAQQQAQAAEQADSTTGDNVDDTQETDQKEG